MTRTLHRDEFRAMGTACSVSASAESFEAELATRACDAARHEVAACERALSRFEPTSELTRLNASAGSWAEVGERLLGALGAALRARAATGGRFDPTVLPALAAAGYDRSFELLTNRAPLGLNGWSAGARIEIDRHRRKARVELGTAVDLGGIGKGFAANRAIQQMRLAWPGLTGALVDLGGDIGVWGTAPEGGPWRIDVDEPRRPGHVSRTLELTGGGVATSGRLTRRFGPGGLLHHLIDPTTGKPSIDGPLAVTVVAPSAVDAEAHATALAVSTLADARAHLDSRPDLSALFFPSSGGEPVTFGRLPLAAPSRPQARFVITTPEGRSLCL